MDEAIEVRVERCFPSWDKTALAARWQGTASVPGRRSELGLGRVHLAYENLRACVVRVVSAGVELRGLGELVHSAIGLETPIAGTPAGDLDSEFGVRVATMMGVGLEPREILDIWRPAEVGRHPDGEMQDHPEPIVMEK